MRIDDDLVQERLIAALPDLQRDLDVAQPDPEDIISALNEVGLFVVPSEAFFDDE